MLPREPMTVLDLLHLALVILGTCLGATVLWAVRDLYLTRREAQRALELDVLRALEQGPVYVDRIPLRLHRVLSAMEAAGHVTRCGAGLWQPRALAMLTPAGRRRLKARLAAQGGR